mmetsp:Transcript_29954/g.63550  ORF Transcript_29954/g.63550 Transcript_29954/m.63550 type:complete len:307 (-) Transcript_29954:505-1425(-)
MDRKGHGCKTSRGGRGRTEGRARVSKWKQGGGAGDRTRAFRVRGGRAEGPVGARGGRCQSGSEATRGRRRRGGQEGGGRRRGGEGATGDRCRGGGAPTERGRSRGRIGKGTEGDRGSGGEGAGAPEEEGGGGGAGPKGAERQHGRGRERERPLRRPRHRPDGRRGRHQEGVQEAGAEAASRQGQVRHGQPGGRVQDRRQRVRDAQGPAKAGRVRPAHDERRPSSHVAHRVRPAAVVRRDARGRERDRPGRSRHTPDSPPRSQGRDTEPRPDRRPVHGQARQRHSLPVRRRLVVPERHSLPPRPHGP